MTTAHVAAQRLSSGAPGLWLTNNRMAKTEVACAELFGFHRLLLDA
jgi:hypothetical protein